MMVPNEFAIPRNFNLAGSHAIDLRIYCYGCIQWLRVQIKFISTPAADLQQNQKKTQRLLEYFHNYHFNNPRQSIWQPHLWLGHDSAVG
jgi:hypothetical protein